MSTPTLLLRTSLNGFVFSILDKVFYCKDNCSVMLPSTTTSETPASTSTSNSSHITDCNENDTINNDENIDDFGIVDLALIENGQYLIALYGNKRLLIWNLLDVSALPQMVNLLRKALTLTVVQQYNRQSYIIVGDKTGDVLLLKWIVPGSANASTSAVTAASSSSSPWHSLLQHTSSIITDLVVVNEAETKEIFLISSDRDEKIRVSSFPKAVRTVSFCLGHTAFVGKLMLFGKEKLVSFGGDGMLCIWMFKTGELLKSWMIPQLDETDTITPCVLEICGDFLIAAIKEREGMYILKLNNNVGEINCDEKIHIVNLCGYPTSVLMNNEFVSSDALPKKPLRILVSFDKSFFLKEYELEKMENDTYTLEWIDNDDCAYLKSICSQAISVVEMFSTKQTLTSESNDDAASDAVSAGDKKKKKNQDFQLRKKRVLATDWKEKYLPGIKLVKQSKVCAQQK